MSFEVYALSMMREKEHMWHATILPSDYIGKPLTMDDNVIYIAVKFKTFLSLNNVVLFKDKRELDGARVVNNPLVVHDKCDKVDFDLVEIDFVAIKDG